MFVCHTHPYIHVHIHAHTAHAITHHTFFLSRTHTDLEICVQVAGERWRMAARTHDADEATGSGGRVAQAGASHAYPDPRGHRYLGCGFTRRKHTYFSEGGAIGTPSRGGKYIYYVK